jgi:hypothetical protein
MRQATTAKVGLDLAKSARFTVPVPINRLLRSPFARTEHDCRCPIRSTERSCPKNSGNLTNVGSDLFFRTLIEKYSGWR